MNEKIAKLKEMISKSENIVFFGGAGVSTESGIPDFRSEDGIYNQEWTYPPETIMTYSFSVPIPKNFIDFPTREGLISM